MAIMNQCCCCGVRSGSVASAIYSMVLAIVGLAYFGWDAARTNETLRTLRYLGYDVGGVFDAYYAIEIIACLVFVIMIIACIFVFIAISQDIKGMLIPFMVAQGLHFVWYILMLAVDAALIAKIGNEGGYAYLAIIILLVPFFIGDLVCLLCVISQYQEYSDGRGRAIDQPQPGATTVVIHQTAPPAAAQQAPPPAYK